MKKKLFIFIFMIVYFAAFAALAAECKGQKIDPS